MGNDWALPGVYDARMRDAPHHDWYLKEWLATLDRSVAWLEDETGWTHRIASQLVNRKLRWHRDHLDLVARLLHLSPYELLLHPEDAMRIRRWRDTALEIAAENRQSWHGADPDVSDRLKARHAV